MSLKKFIYFSERVEQFIDPNIFAKSMNINLDHHFEKLAKVPANQFYMRDKLFEKFALKPLKYSAMNIKIAEIALLDQKEFEGFLIKIAILYHIDQWLQLAKPELFETFTPYVSYEAFKQFASKQDSELPLISANLDRKLIEQIEQNQFDELVLFLHDFGKSAFQFWLSHQPKQIKKRFMLINHALNSDGSKKHLNYQNISHILSHINLSNEAIN